MLSGYNGPKLLPINRHIIIMLMSQVFRIRRDFMLLLYSTFLYCLIINNSKTDFSQNVIDKPCRLTIILNKCEN